MNSKEKKKERTSLYEEEIFLKYRTSREKKHA